MPVQLQEQNNFQDQEKQPGCFASIIADAGTLMFNLRLRVPSALLMRSGAWLGLGVEDAWVLPPRRLLSVSMAGREGSLLSLSEN